VSVFQNRRILVGVTGSIAIYKACDLVFALRKEDARPTVVMTECATRLVTPETFRALSGEPVHTRMFGGEHDAMPHIALAEAADLVIVAPATANFLAKLAAGIADDLLSTLMLTVACPVLVAPAMNVQMWAHPAVARNAEIVKRDGAHLVEPVAGQLACRTEGKGKMAPVEEILRAAEGLL
jgi:phosphopantothenoylcysteine decarboxylase/phosphopantothenate--cysteine ligase